MQTWKQITNFTKKPFQILHNKLKKPLPVMDNFDYRQGITLGAQIALQTTSIGLSAVPVIGPLVSSFITVSANIISPFISLHIRNSKKLSPTEELENSINAIQEQLNESTVQGISEEEISKPLQKKGNSLGSKLKQSKINQYGKQSIYGRIGISKWQSLRLLLGLITLIAAITLFATGIGSILAIILSIVATLFITSAGVTLFESSKDKEMLEKLEKTTEHIKKYIDSLDIDENTKQEYLDLVNNAQNTADTLQQLQNLEQDNKAQLETSKLHPKKDTHLTTKLRSNAVTKFFKKPLPIFNAINRGQLAFLALGILFSTGAVLMFMFPILLPIAIASAILLSILAAIFLTLSGNKKFKSHVIDNALEKSQALNEILKDLQQKHDPLSDTRSEITILSDDIDFDGTQTALSDNDKGRKPDPDSKGDDHGIKKNDDSKRVTETQKKCSNNTVSTQAKTFQQTTAQQTKKSPNEITEKNTQPKNTLDAAKRNTIKRPDTEKATTQKSSSNPKTTKDTSTPQNKHSNSKNIPKEQKFDTTPPIPNKETLSSEKIHDFSASHPPPLQSNVKALTNTSPNSIFNDMQQHDPSPKRETVDSNDKPKPASSTESKPPNTKDRHTDTSHSLEKILQSSPPINTNDISNISHDSKATHNPEPPPANILPSTNNTSMTVK